MILLKHKFTVKTEPGSLFLATSFYLSSLHFLSAQSIIYNILCYSICQLMTTVKRN